MISENQNKRTLLLSIPLARSCMALTLLCITVSPVLSDQQGTTEQREACTPDVFRLCSAFIPDANEITTCLRERNAELSNECRKEMTQIPSTAGNGARKRTLR